MSAVLDIGLDVVGFVLLALGGFFCLVGAIGLNRMPDVFTRMHAASVTDTLGVGLLVLGMMTQTSDWTVLVRLLTIVLVLYVTGAVASHALARAALHDGAEPLLAQSDGTLKATPCGQVDQVLGGRVARPLMPDDGAIVPAEGPDTPGDSEGAAGKGEPSSNS